MYYRFVPGGFCFLQSIYIYICIQFRPPVQINPCLISIGFFTYIIYRSTATFLYVRNFYKLTTSLNGPHKSTLAIGRFRKVLYICIYIYIYIYIHIYVSHSLHFYVNVCACVCVCLLKHESKHIPSTCLPMLQYV